jgi:Zn-dependent protease
MGDFLNWSFPLFRIFGIPVRMHWTLPVLVVAHVLQGWVKGGELLAGWWACMMGALFLSVLIHELGHCFAARSAGGHADEILLWPLGGLSYVGHGGGPKDDIRVAAAGPMMHVPIAAACLGALMAAKAPWTWQYLNIFHGRDLFSPWAQYFWMNLLVGVIKMQVVLFSFNLLVPAYPLDGGRILVNFLMTRHGRDRAAVVSTYFSIPIGILMIVWSFAQQDIFLGLIGVWVLSQALLIHKLVKTGEIGAHPMFGSAPEYDYMPERPRRPGMMARWRARRAQKRMEREAAAEARLQAQLDAVLDKINREGIGSLTPAEKAILDEASRRARMK